MVFLLKTHHHQIVAHRALRASLIPLRKHLRDELVRQKETVSYNLAALRYLKRQDQTTKMATFFEEAINDEEKIKEIREKVAEGDLKKRKRITIQA